MFTPEQRLVKHRDSRAPTGIDYVSIRLRALILLAGLSVALLECGEGGGFPGGPVEPPGPNLNAEIVATNEISFGLCTGPGAGCYYTQEYANTGQGCANNLHGKVRVFQDETLLETDEWWLESSFVIQPGGSVPVDDCCFHQDTVRERTRSVTETFWNNVPCG